MPDATTKDSDPLDQLEAEAWSALERLGRALHVKEPGLQATLEAILAAAVATIDGTDFAGVNLQRGASFQPQAVHGTPPHALDAFQEEHGTGPCIDASRAQQVIRVDDMSTEQRWPGFAALAASLHVQSMLCVPLWVDEVQLGSVSLYSSSAHAFGEPHERLANLFAAHAAVALADGVRTENLRIALRNRDVIGQAKGILMERHRITAQAAFDMLAVASQRANRKLSAVAEDVANTGQIPA